MSSAELHPGASRSDQGQAFGCRRWVLLPALAMSVGWGLRGFIGGGPFGAMIPGALLALALAGNMGLPPAATARLAAFGAVGIGLGGQETYGQTVRFVTDAGPMFWRGVAGLGVKGAVWGLVGGLMLAAGAAGARLSRRQWSGAWVALVVGTWIGWRCVDDPKLLYFSHPVDRPRPEIWAGLLTGGVAFFAWVAGMGGPVVARALGIMAAGGALGGGLGFALGGAGYAGGMALGWPADLYPGWKQMEFVFGACLGAGLGLAAWTQAPLLRAHAGTSSARDWTGSRGWWPLALAAAIGALLWGLTRVPVRFDYTVAGVAVLALAVAFEMAAWQLAITVTIGAFLLYVASYFHQRIPGAPPYVAHAVALLLTAAASRVVAGLAAAAGGEVPWKMQRLLLWSAVAAALVHTALHPHYRPALFLPTAAFVAGAVAITRLARSSR